MEVEEEEMEEMEEVEEMDARKIFQRNCRALGGLFRQNFFK